MRHLVTGLLLGFAIASLGACVMVMTRFVFRGFVLYVRFRYIGKLACAEDVRRRYGERVRLYVLRDLWVFNLIAYAREKGDTKRMLPSEVLADGVMVNTFRATKSFLRNEFPDVQVELGTLSQFE